MRRNALDCPVIKGDICQKELLEQIVNEFRPTHILHLAAQAGVRYSIENPDVYIDSNVKGFLNILELCRHHHFPLTYASSSSVYGLNKKIPFHPNDRTDSPANLYGATKKAGEAMAFSYHHCYGIPINALRYFTVYGPWGRPDMAYFLFAEAIRDNRLIQLYNHGKMARDFTYIDDVVAGTLSAMDQTGHNIFNLGSHKPIPLMTLVETLEEALGKKACIELVDTPPGEIEQTCADISESQQILGYHPQTSFDEGIRNFTSWFQSELALH